MWFQHLEFRHNLWSWPICSCHGGKQHAAGWNSSYDFEQSLNAIGTVSPSCMWRLVKYKTPLRNGRWTHHLSPQHPPHPEEWTLKHRKGRAWFDRLLSSNIITLLRNWNQIADCCYSLYFLLQTYTVCIGLYSLACSVYTSFDKRIEADCCSTCTYVVVFTNLYSENHLS